MGATLFAGLMMRSAVWSVGRRLELQSRDGILVLGDCGQVQEANPAMATMLGRPLDSLPGQGVRALGFNYDSGERYLSIDGFLPTE